jgi:hypothetical protein
MIARPALGAQPTFASLTNADHQRVHQLWDEFAAAVELCLRGLIQRRVAELSLEIQHYFRTEEILISYL